MEFHENKNAFSLILIMFVILTSGCISAQVDTHVTSDAEIDKMEIELGLDSSMYNLMDMESDEPLSEELTEDVEEDALEDADYSEVEVSEEERDGTHYFTYVYHDIEPGEDSNIQVYEEDGYVVYEEVDLEESLGGDSGFEDPVEEEPLPQEPTEEEDQFEEQFEDEFEDESETLPSTYDEEDFETDFETELEEESQDSESPEEFDTEFEDDAVVQDEEMDMGMEDDLFGDDEEIDEMVGEMFDVE